MNIAKLAEKLSLSLREGERITWRAMDASARNICSAKNVLMDEEEKAIGKKKEQNWEKRGVGFTGIWSKTHVLETEKRDKWRRKERKKKWKWPWTSASDLDNLSIIVPFFLSLFHFRRAFSHHQKYSRPFSYFFAFFLFLSPSFSSIRRKRRRDSSHLIFLCISFSSSSNGPCLFKTRKAKRRSFLLVFFSPAFSQVNVQI